MRRSTVSNILNNRTQLSSQCIETLIIFPFVISISTRSVISETYNLVLLYIAIPFGAFSPVIQLNSIMFPLEGETLEMNPF